MDYRVFRATYRDRRSGERRQSPTWHVDFRDHLKRKQRIAGETQQRETHQFAGKLLDLVKARRCGDPLDERLRRFIDGLDDGRRKRLIEIGLIEDRRSEVETPLLIHLEGDAADVSPRRLGFRQSLESRGNSRKHIDTTIQRIRDALEACDLIYWRDLNRAGVATTIEVWLGRRREEKEIGGQTFNYIVRDLKAFCRWLHQSGRAPSTALTQLQRVSNAEMDSERRRALSIEEMRWLIAAAETGDEHHGMSGAARALLYRFCFETGIRPLQMQALTVADFDLESSPATVTTSARYVKRRRDHVQHLTPGMATILKEAFVMKAPAAVAFPTPQRFRPAEMLREDLTRARQLWVSASPFGSKERERRLKSDFLESINHRDERAVFYSLRHGHGTALASAGIPEKDIAASMHHASRVTTARYLHTDRQALGAAIASLPDLSYPSGQKMTGTDPTPATAGGEVKSVQNPDCLRRACATGRTTANGSEQDGGQPESGKTAITAEKAEISRALARERLIGLLAELADAVDSKAAAHPTKTPEKRAKRPKSTLRLRRACASVASDEVPDPQPGELRCVWSMLSWAGRCGVVAAAIGDLRTAA